MVARSSDDELKRTVVLNYAQNIYRYVKSILPCTKIY